MLKAPLSFCFGRLTELQIFNASHNKLVTLPASFGQLYKLNDLILDHNRLLFLPGEITALKELRTFHVEDNYIGDVPEYGKMTTVAGALWKDLWTLLTQAEKCRF